MSDLTRYAVIPYVVALSFLLAWAAWRDIATRTIPDRISVALALLGLAVRLTDGWEAFGHSLLVSLAFFFVLLPFCSRGILGGADLKLVSALALGLPPQVSLSLIVTVTIVGGALAALYLALGAILRRIGSVVRSVTRPRSLLARIALIECWRIRRHAPLPYGLAIAIGAVFVVLQNRGP